MNDEKDTQEKEHGSTGNAIKAGVTGAVIGAAVGAAAVTLMDKEKREKIAEKAHETMDKVRTEADKHMQTAKEQVSQAAGKIEDKAREFGKKMEGVREDMDTTEGNE